MAEEKICPLMSGFVPVTWSEHPVIQIAEGNTALCKKQACALWVNPYTTEHQPAGGCCAFVQIALKNSDGLQRV